MYRSVIALCYFCQVVVEFDGVVVEDTSDLHTKAWLQLADEEVKSRPLQFALKRAEGMKNEQVCWLAPYVIECCSHIRLLCHLRCGRVHLHSTMIDLVSTSRILSNPAGGLTLLTLLLCRKPISSMSPMQVHNFSTVFSQRGFAHKGNAVSDAAPVLVAGGAGGVLLVAQPHGGAAVVRTERGALCCSGWQPQATRGPGRASLSGDPCQAQCEPSWASVLCSANSVHSK